MPLYLRQVADKELVLFPQEEQLGSGKTVRMTVGQAVAGGESRSFSSFFMFFSPTLLLDVESTGTINNETLGYFMAKTWVRETSPLASLDST